MHRETDETEWRERYEAASAAACGCFSDPEADAIRDAYKRRQAKVSDLQNPLPDPPVTSELPRSGADIGGDGDIAGSNRF